MSENEKDYGNSKLVSRMDGVADALLGIVEKEGTSAMQKGRLFAQVMAYMKIRSTLLPSGEGGKLEEMQRDIKSSGGGGKRNTRRTNEYGRDITDIIKKLPRSRNAVDPDGDPQGAERESIGGNGPGGGVPINGGGNVVGNVDGVGNLN